MNYRRATAVAKLDHDQKTQIMELKSLAPRFCGQLLESGDLHRLSLHTEVGCGYNSTH